MMYSKTSSIALGVALTSKGTSGRNHNTFRLGAVLTDNKAFVMSIGVNSYKTHPYLKKYYKFPYLHAESAALLRYGVDRCKGLTLTVVRVKKDGSLGNAQPCPACKKLMLDLGIKECYYSKSNEEWGVIHPGTAHTS